MCFSMLSDIKRVWSECLSVGHMVRFSSLEVHLDIMQSINRLKLLSRLHPASA